jgi:hypothetical protein
MSEALLRVAALKHALIMLDLASCGHRAAVASQYWQLTAPDMQQMLMHDDTTLLSRLDETEWPSAVHCSWSDMPGPLLNWVQRYRRETARRTAPRC